MPMPPIPLKCPQCGADLPPAGETTITCPSCGVNLLIERRPAGAAAPRQTVVKGLRLKPFTCTDTQGTGLELFRMLIPSGWSFQGGCRWLLDNPGMPAVVCFQMWNPHGTELFEVLPNMNFTWNNNPLARGLVPPGSRYFGAEVRPPVSIRDALRQYVLPRYRAAVQNLQILNEEPVPELPRLVRSQAASSGGTAEGGKLRFRYLWQGWSLDEELYGLVEAFHLPIQTAFSAGQAIFWFIDYLFTFRAQAGRLDGSAALFKAMLASFRLNPAWSAAYEAITRYLAQQQIQRIHHIGQIGEIYARMGSEMRQQNMDGWRRRQDTYDRLATDWSRAIRDVDAFFDPHRQELVELPSGYGHAWANNLGEYILTDDPNFNPNLDSNLHWETMNPR